MSALFTVLVLFSAGGKDPPAEHSISCHSASLGLVPCLHLSLARLPGVGPSIICLVEAVVLVRAWKHWHAEGVLTGTLFSLPLLQRLGIRPLQRCQLHLLASHRAQHPRLLQALWTRLLTWMWPWSWAWASRPTAAASSSGQILWGQVRIRG